MAEYVDVETPAKEMASTAGAEEGFAAIEQVLSGAKTRISKLILDLNSQYKFFNNAKTVEDMIKNKEEALSKQINNIKAAAAKIHPSSKGGADISPLDAEQNIISSINEAKKILRDARNAIYGNKKTIEDEILYKKTALEAMATVYQVRQALTGMTEKIIIAYKGDSGAVISTEVPIVDFLRDERTIENIGIGIRASSSFRGGDPFQLTFKNSVISQLASTQGNITQSIQYQENDNLNKILSTKSDFDEYFIKTGAIRVEGGKYKVLRRGEPGYVIENILANLHSTAEMAGVQLSKKGTEEWYTGGDFKGVDETGAMVEYSAKSFLYGTPTLAKISSIQRILMEIYNSLNMSLSPGQLEGKIRSLLNANSGSINAAANRDIENVLKILSG